MKVHPGRKHNLTSFSSLAVGGAEGSTFSGRTWGRGCRGVPKCLATFGGSGGADGIHVPMLSVFQSTLLNVPMGGGGAVGSVGGGGDEAAFAQTE